MKVIAIILLPFSWIYGFIVSLRRSMFQWGIFKRKRPEIPAIVVGNISAGGTGKTPFVIWLSNAMRDKSVAILSRGYKRKSKGFFEVNSTDGASQFGDEALEIFQHFHSEIPVFVCEDRVEGIHRISKERPGTEVVILDDGFQHLRLQPNVSVLLCNYNRPFFKDYPFPLGHLREFAFNARYADVIVVSKCPANMDMAEGLKWYDALSGYGKAIFFANYENAAPADIKGNTLKPGSRVVLVSALANNAAFCKWAEKDYLVSKHFSYVDHYPFKNSDISDWEAALEKHNADGVLVSRKDFMKLGKMELKMPIYITFTQVQILFDGEDDLIALISDKING
ncbi:MAG: tetraacyldisaccharide 4'-kinase [Bacteroidetes bacterium]|nr:tetraacyldisaccharide 4'-kinase [Bacteroidota bacterium]